MFDSINPDFGSSSDVIVLHRHVHCVVLVFHIAIGTYSGTIDLDELSSMASLASVAVRVVHLLSEIELEATLLLLRVRRIHMQS